MNRMRLAIALITAATLVALFVTAPPEAEPVPPVTATAPEVDWPIDARDDTLDRRRVPKGARVTMTVVADVTDEVHVHGYDIKGPVEPGKPATIFVRAELTGRFEIELEESGTQIAQLTVVP